MSQQVAKILTQALPYIHRFKGKIMVIKYGGNAMIDESLKQQFAADVSLLKAVGIKPVVVHGGGPQMSKYLEKMGKQSQFFNGLRITDDETMEVAEMVLAGSINKSIVQMIQQAGGQAVGISGADGELIKAQAYAASGEVDLGRVGRVKTINQNIIQVLIDNDYIPVIAPVGVDDQRRSLNVNADNAASAIAVALQAEKFMLLTNTKGILDKQGKLVISLNRQQTLQLVDDGTIQTGMLPKIECALNAISNGVKSVQIIDGRVEHSILIELFTDTGVGSYISA